MAVKTIYLNPNDVLRVRIIRDASLPKNEREWVFQMFPQSYLFSVGDHGDLISDPLINRDMRHTPNHDHNDP